MFSKETNNEAYQNLYNFIQKTHTTLIFSNSYFNFLFQEDASFWNLSQLKKTNLPFTAPNLSCTMSITQSAKFYFSAACMTQVW